MQNLSKEELKELSDKYGDVKLEGGLNDKVGKLMSVGNPKSSMLSIKEIKRKLGIKDEHIANMFGYANAHSYRTSKAKDKMDRGLEAFYDLITRKNA